MPTLSVLSMFFQERTHPRAIILRDDPEPISKLIPFILLGVIQLEFIIETIPWDFNGFPL